LERRGKCKGNFTDRVNFVENAFKKQVCQWQGDQIERIFAQLAIVYIKQFK
jgi:hypothetical protein